MSRQVHAGYPFLLARYLDVAVAGPTVVFDWQGWGADKPYTALLFAVVNKGVGSVDQTVEISVDGVTACTVGAAVPVAITIPAGEASADPFGIDLMAPYWRLCLTGTSICDVYVYAIPRSAMQLPDLV